MLDSEGSVLIRCPGGAGGTCRGDMQEGHAGVTCRGNMQGGHAGVTGRGDIQGWHAGVIVTSRILFSAQTQVLGDPQPQKSVLPRKHWRPCS